MSSSWIDSWRGQALDELTARFENVGAADARGWAESESAEDFAQLARYLALRAAWRRMRDAVSNAMASQGAENLFAAGVSRDEVEGLLRRTVYEVTFELLYLIDEPDGTLHSEPPSTDVDDDHPRWTLMEVSPDGDLTGRDVGGLHESLLEVDPSGREGAGWL